MEFGTLILQDKYYWIKRDKTSFPKIGKITPEKFYALNFSLVFNRLSYLLFVVIACYGGRGLWQRTVFMLLVVVKTVHEQLPIILLRDAHNQKDVN